METQTSLENSKTWTETAGVANSWQLLSGSGFSQVSPDLYTLPMESAIIISIDPGRLFPAAIPEIQINHHPSLEDRKIGRGLAALLNFSLEPDEPEDQDIKSHQMLRFME